MLVSLGGSPTGQTLSWQSHCISHCSSTTPILFSLVHLIISHINFSEFKTLTSIVFQSNGLHSFSSPDRKRNRTSIILECWVFCKVNRQCQTRMNRLNLQDPWSNLPWKHYRVLISLNYLQDQWSHSLFHYYRILISWRVCLNVTLYSSTFE